MSQKLETAILLINFR